MFKNKSKVVILALIIAITSSIISGCYTKGISKKKKIIKVNIAADPKTLDPGLNNSIEGFQIICNAFEGLTNVDQNDTPIPGVAEKWETSKDGLTYAFHLRKDAKWSDGKPVTAKDFEYAWKRALAPETASQYAYQLYYLKNGQSYNNNKSTAEQVGVNAIDDYTLIVNLEAPIPYFLSLLATPTYDPVRKDIVEKNPKDWATKPETYISNGPFKMAEYKLKDSLNFEKNSNYWDVKNVKLDRIEFKTLENENSYYAAFKTGQLDLISQPPMAEVTNLLNNSTANIFPYLGTYYYNFNLSFNAEKINPEAAKALKDVRVRKALSLAIDRADIVEKVTKGRQIAATSIVPSSVKSNGTKFKNKDYLPTTADTKQAKKLLAEAGYPNSHGFPKIDILYNTMRGNEIIAEAVQEMWRKNLGIDVTLKSVERKVHLTDLKNHDFTISKGGWIGDYNDPMTFLDLFTASSGNNYSGFDNLQYEKLIAAAKTEPDAKKRTILMHDAEDLLMSYMPIIPIYEYTNIVCMNNKLTGVYITPLGFYIFKNADVKK